ncbi:uncharacterized protein CDAR_478681 [Caerostris darwini]|uniref:Uncharacterized protein n=1 Tax=Caerostris darwini TaxID=1538125 RepID=A0AAV4QQL0_9ARAC|nr:uncharacterized protein CDAR_478681 [Caerostris darwini]
MHGSSRGHTGQCLSACPSSEGSIIPTVGPVTILRIHIDEEVDHWVALSEIILEAAPMQALMASVYNISYIFAPPTARTANGLP